MHTTVLVTDIYLHIKDFPEQKILSSSINLSNPTRSLIFLLSSPTLSAAKSQLMSKDVADMMNTTLPLQKKFLHDIQNHLD